MKPNIADVLRILLKYGIRCNVSSKELLTYLKASSYEDDIIELDEILRNEMLLLHEVVEICFLQENGLYYYREHYFRGLPQNLSSTLKSHRDRIRGSYENKKV